MGAVYQPKNKTYERNYEKHRMRYAISYDCKSNCIFYQSWKPGQAGLCIFPGKISIIWCIDYSSKMALCHYAWWHDYALSFSILQWIMDETVGLHSWAKGNMWIRQWILHDVMKQCRNRDFVREYGLTTCLIASLCYPSVIRLYVRSLEPDAEFILGVPLTIKYFVNQNLERLQCNIIALEVYFWAVWEVLLSTSLCTLCKNKWWHSTETDSSIPSSPI